MSAMQPHQQRMLEEASELQERTHKLAAFLAGPAAAAVDDEERGLMHEQLVHMLAYGRTLNKRINRWRAP